MIIYLRFFALYKEKSGTANTTIDMPSGSSVDDLINKMHEIYPSLPRNTTTLIAVNYQYVESDTILHDGDEIAIIPPVSGG